MVGTGVADAVVSGSRGSRVTARVGKAKSSSGILLAFAFREQRYPHPKVFLAASGPARGTGSGPFLALHVCDPSRGMPSFSGAGSHLSFHVTL